MNMKIDIVVIEVTEDHTERLEVFSAMLDGNEGEKIEQAKRLVSLKGYNVLHDEEGGCNEFVGVNEGNSYVAITVK